MINYIINKLCPEKAMVKTQQVILEDSLKTIKELRINLQKLEDVISNNKTIFTDEISKLAITSHAIHRYRERHGGKGSDDEISKMLFKLLIQQLYATDRLQDGKHVLKKGVVGVVKNNTLVTIAPKRDIGAPRLK